MKKLFGFCALVAFTVALAGCGGSPTTAPLPKTPPITPSVGSKGSEVPPPPPPPPSKEEKDKDKDKDKDKPKG
jgi:hypothetical protein